MLKYRSGQYKLSIALLAVSTLVGPAAGWLAIRAVRTHENRVADWLPGTYAETRQLRWFRDRFIADQFLVISWEGCQLGATPSEDDPRIERLTEALAGVALSGGEGELCFQSVTNGRRLLSELTQGASNVPLPAAIDRLKGSMIGEDGKQTCVFAVLSDGAVDRMRDVIARPRTDAFLRPEAAPSPLFAAIADAGLAAEAVRLGGPPVDNVSIDEEGQKTLARLAGFSGLLGVGLAWWSLRSLRMTSLVFLCGVGSAALAMAVVPLSGCKMDAILMSMPALVYVLAVSGSLHYLNYYRSIGSKWGYQFAAYEAVIHAWRPALLCSVTTACGLLSLLASDITPIRRFGAFSASGVLLTLIVLFAFLPATLVVWPWKPSDTAREEASGVSATFWRRFARSIERRYGLVLLTSLVLIAALVGGLPRTRTSVDLLKLFSPDARLIQDYRWFEDRIGKLVPAEIVVRFPKRVLRESLPETATPRSVAASYTFVERMEIVQRVESAIRHRLGPDGERLVGATMSAATFAPEIEQHEGVARRFAVNEELLGARADLERSGYLRTDQQTGEELWRVTVRCAAFHAVERDDIVASIRNVVQPITAGSFGGAEAMAEESRFAEEAPKPLRVAVYAPEGIDDATQAAAHLAQGRGSRVSVLDRPLASVDQDVRDALNGQDLILVAESGKDAISELQAGKVSTQLVSVSSGDGDLDVAYTGVLPIVYKAQRELLNSLVQSAWWSFVTIAPLMVFVCRSFLGGLLVMLPNALPILVVFGGMAWIGAPIDIGSMMAASIALGVAVDDTIHFLAWYREDVERLGGRAAAVLSAYQRSAAPTLQAGLVNGLGLSVFAMSSFVPTQRFGVLMLAILGAGIVAELVLLPALLFSPLGKVFDPAPDRLAIGSAPVTVS